MGWISHRRIAVLAWSPSDGLHRRGRVPGGQQVVGGDGGTPKVRGGLLVGVVSESTAMVIIPASGSRIGARPTCLD